MCVCSAGPVRAADGSAEVCAGAAVLQRHGVQHAGPQQTGTLSLSLSVSLSALSPSSASHVHPLLCDERRAEVERSGAVV